MNRGVKHTLWGILGVWVILMIAFSPKLIEAHREVTDAQQLFTGYATSLLNHRYEEAYSFCGSEFRNAMPYDRFAKLQMDLEEQYGILKSFKRVGCEVHGKGNPLYWRGVVDGDFVYEKKTLRFEFVFHKDADRWVIYGYEQL